MGRWVRGEREGRWVGERGERGWVGERGERGWMDERRREEKKVTILPFSFSRW